MGRILSYCAIAAVLYVVGMYCLTSSEIVNGILRFFLLAGFVLLIARREGIPLPQRHKSASK